MMEEEKKSKLYAFEEFEQFSSLSNIVPCGDGNSLKLLNEIVFGIQNGSFERNPSLLIAGEGANAFSIAFSNTLCSQDIRLIQANYFSINKILLKFFHQSLPDTIHIISNPARLNMSENIVWEILKTRKYELSSTGEFKEYIHVNGLIVLTAEEKYLSSPTLSKEVDFKIFLEPYSHTQLEMIVEQRLKFCGIEFSNDEAKSIVELGKCELSKIKEILKLCVLHLNNLNETKLTVDDIKKCAVIAKVSLDSND